MSAKPEVLPVERKLSAEQNKSASEEMKPVGEKKLQAEAPLGAQEVILENIRGVTSGEQDTALEKLLLELSHVIKPHQEGVNEVKVVGLVPGKLGYLPLEFAFKIVGVNAMGQYLPKENIYGHSRVIQHEHVFYKHVPESPDEGFLIEQAVYQLSRSLGAKVVAPTRLLEFHFPKEAGGGRYKVQASLDAGLDCDTGLKFNTTGLDEILRLPQDCAALIKILRERERFVTDLPVLISGEYFKEWQSQHPNIEKLKQDFLSDAECLQRFKLDFETIRNLSELEFHWFVKLKVFLDAIYALDTNAWPLEFRTLREEPGRVDAIKSNLKKENEGERKYKNEAELNAALEREFRKIELQDHLMQINGLKLVCPLQVLALIERYKHFNLSAEALTALFALPKTFAVLAKLFPKVSQGRPAGPDLLKVVENIFTHFDQTQVLQHLVLALVSEPNDHKGDNFRVRIRHGKDGNLLSLEIVAVDNDKSMDGVFSRRQDEHFPKVKTLFYGVQPLVECRLDKSFCESLFSLSPQQFVLKWLQNLSEAFHAMPEVLLQQSLPEKFPLVLCERIKDIQQALRSSDQFKEVFSKVEPILALYYERLCNRYSNPSLLEKALWNNAESLESLIGKKFDAKDWEKALAVQPTALKDPMLAVPFLESIKDYLTGIASSEMQDKGVQYQMLLLLTRLKRILPGSKVFVLEAPILDEVFIGLCRAEPMSFIEWLVKDCAWDINRILREAVRLNLSHIIPILVESGADIHAEDKEKLTILDIAVRDQKIDCIRALLAHGPSGNLNLKLAMDFVYHHSKTSPAAVKHLLKFDPALIFELALSVMTEDRTIGEEDITIRTKKGLKCLKESFCQEIFKGQGSIPKENCFGQHAVKKIPCRVSEELIVHMHFKERPEFFGREYMVYSLGKLLFGGVTPPVALWKVNRKEGVFTESQREYPMLAAMTVEGPTLFEVLAFNPKLSDNLDEEHFSKLVILTMLLNPEDGRRDNYILEATLQGDKPSYRIVGIDNDRAFVRPIALNKEGEEIEGPNSLQVKTILYCLDAMDRSIHSKVRERLLKIQAGDFLTDWLEVLGKEQAGIESLFKKNTTAYKLNIVFKPSLIEDIHQKIRRMQSILLKKPNIRLLTLLRYVIPELGARYQNAHAAFNIPIARFDSLTRGCFKMKAIPDPDLKRMHELFAVNVNSGERKIAHDVSTTTPSVFMEMTRDLRLEMMFGREEEGSLEKAKKRLIEVEENDKKLKEIFTGILQCEQTALDGFQSLNTQQQEWVFNGKAKDLTLPGIDFSQIKKRDGTLDLEFQESLLRAMKGRWFRLRLLNYTNLTDARLKQLLKLQNALSFLELRGCVGLSERSLLDLSLICPSIEKLKIQSMPQIQIVSNITFPNLRILYICDCENLKEWLPSTVPLQRFNLENCKALMKINKNLPKLHRFTAKDCNMLHHHDFYQKHPALIRLPLENRDKEDVEGFILALKEVLLRAHFDFDAQMNEASCRWWQEAISVWQTNIKDLTEKKLIKTILMFLQDWNSDVRARASEALGRVQIPHELKQAVAKSLLALLKDESGVVRANASEALGRVQIPHRLQKEVVESLLALLKDKNGYVKVCASEALGCVAETPELQKVAVETLLTLLKNENWNVKERASMALGRIQIPLELQRAVVKTLLRLLNDERWSVRAVASEALGRVQIPHGLQKEVVESLLAHLENEDKDVRVSAIEALGKVHIPVDMLKQVFEALRTLLKDDNKKLRIKVITTLSLLLSPHCLLTQFSTWLKQNSPMQQQSLQNNPALQVIPGLSLDPVAQGRLPDIKAAANAAITDLPHPPALALEIKGIREDEVLLFSKAANAAGARKADGINDKVLNPSANGGVGNHRQTLQTLFAHVKAGNSSKRMNY